MLVHTGSEQRPVYLLGTGESVETPLVSQMADFTSSRASRPKVFAEVGITHNDVDHLMIYDAPCSLPGAKISVCHAVGGMFAASGTIVMSNERS